MIYIPLIVTVLANLLYHLSSKNLPQKIDPFFSLIVVYSVALILSLAVYVFTKQQHTIQENIRLLNWGTLGLGVAIVGVEIGFMWMYRAGWPVSYSAILVTALLTLVLIPIGILFFKEVVSLKEVAGILLCIAGVYLLSN